MATFTKDPSAELDYQWDWSTWMATNDFISSGTVTATGGLTIGTISTGTASVTAWIAGGTVDHTYVCTCQITTAQGRTDERSIAIAVADR